VGTHLFRNRVSSPLQLRNLGAIADQDQRHFIDLSADLHAHARIALDVGPPRLGIGKLLFQSEIPFASLHVEFVAAADDVDRHRVGDAVPGTSLELDGVFSDRVVHLVDPVPVRHGLMDDFPGQPQSRPGGPAAFREFFTAWTDVCGLEAGHAQRRERHDHEGSDHQQADLQCAHHPGSPDVSVTARGIRWRPPTFLHRPFANEYYSRTIAIRHEPGARAQVRWMADAGGRRPPLASRPRAPSNSRSQYRAAVPVERSRRIPQKWAFSFTIYTILQ